MSKVVVDGLMTEYSQTGEGQQVLLLHGWGDSRETFADLSEALCSNYLVTALDLPGFGKTQPPPSGWDLTDYANFINKFCKKLNISPYAILGHSNGGAIALRGMGRNILKASKLVLLASSGIRDQPSFTKKCLRVTAKPVKILVSILSDSLESKLKKRIYRSLGSDMYVVEGMKDTFKKITADDVQNDTVNIKVPTLLIYGAEDNATPIANGELIASQIADARLVSVDGSGHFVHHDTRQLVAENIIEFLIS